MISRRLIANLIAFFVISALLVGYGVVSLLGNPLRSPTVLTTDFPDASGLYQNFTVELNGVPVGTVGAIRLTSHGTRDHHGHPSGHQGARRRPLVHRNRQRPR